MDPINSNPSSSSTPKAIDRCLFPSLSSLDNSNRVTSSSVPSPSTTTDHSVSASIQVQNIEEIRSIEYWQEISRRQAIMLTELQSRIHNLSPEPLGSCSVLGSRSVPNHQNFVITAENRTNNNSSLSTDSLFSDTSHLIDTESSVYSVSSTLNHYNNKDHVLYRNKVLIDKLMHERHTNQQRINYLDNQIKYYQNHIQLLQETVEKDKAYIHELHKLHNDSINKLQNGIRTLKETIKRNNELFHHERSLYTVYIETSHNEIQRLQHQLNHQH